MLVTAVSALEPVPFLREHTQPSSLEGCEGHVGKSGLCTDSKPTPDGQASPADTSMST